MALQLHLDHDCRVYFAVSCNGCGRRFACYDSACYSFTSLRHAALFAGWDVGARPEQEHHCPACSRSRQFTATPTRLLAPVPSR